MTSPNAGSFSQTNVFKFFFYLELLSFTVCKPGGVTWHAALSASRKACTFLPMLARLLPLVRAGKSAGAGGMGAGRGVKQGMGRLGPGRRQVQ